MHAAIGGAQRLDDFGVIEGVRALLARVEDVLEAETLGQFDLRVVVGRGALQIVADETRLRGGDLAARQPAMIRQALVEAEKVVEHHADPQPPAREQTAAVPRHEELERLHQVRRDLQQRLALAQVHADQREVEHLEVAETAVHEPRGARSGAAAEVGLLEQRDPQAAQRGVAGNARANHAAADDQDVERAAVQRGEAGGDDFILSRQGGPIIARRGKLFKRRGRSVRRIWRFPQ